MSTICVRCGKVIAQDAALADRLRVTSSRCKADKYGFHFHKWVLQDVV